MAKKTNLKTLLVMAVILLGFGCTIAAGEVIYVDADASVGGNGQTWATAYKYLQDALNKPPTSGDEIWVAAGTYKPDQGSGQTPGDRWATFQLRNGVAIKGGYAGFGEPDPNVRHIEPYKTILSGDLKGDDGPNFSNNAENSKHVVTGSGTDTTAILNGFTITAGNADGYFFNYYGGGMYNEYAKPTVNDCTFIGNWAEGSGGGMFNMGSSPRLTNCTFTGNSGGGMWNYDDSSPTLSNCTFSGNSADQGGGMSNSVSSPALTNCTFNGNSASGGGGGMFSWSNSSPTLTNCTFSGNSAHWAGGGMVNHDSNSTLVNCTFSGNRAGRNGGGMYNDSNSSPTLTNCTFSGNSAGNDGGGMYNEWSSPTLTNCTFTANSALNGSVLACDSYQQNYPSDVQVTNCILWDGGDEIWNNDGSTIAITYSDVQGGWTGTGNINADPLFIGPNGLDGIGGTADDEDNNVHLRGYSPCINAGDPSGDYSGQVDVDGQPRVAYGRVDMGADEVFPIAGDFEPDGDVDFADFAIFAGNWLLGVGD